MGKQQVKNIPEPVWVFKVLLDAPAAEHTAAPAPAAKRSLRWPLAATGIVSLLIVAGLALWQRPWEPREEPASVEAMAFPLPDRPSIAVLPFTNMSDDPNQGYFADGMTEDLITDLSKLSGLFVIARNSSFSYRGQQVKVRQVAEELGVRYVLEGSVRRAGDQVRINAQLIDATTGGHLWAERYDGSMDDIFDLQDQVTEQIVAALAVKLTADEEERLSLAAKANPEAYDTLLRGLEKLRRYTRETNAEARELFEKAIALDPAYARAYADLAQTFELDARNGWADNRDEAIRRASELIQSALEYDDSMPQVHLVRASIYRAQRRYGEALAASQRSIELDPNYAAGQVNLASVLMSAGRPEEGLAAIREALRRNPRYSFQYLRLLGQAYFLLGRYQAAIPELQKVVDANPEFLTGHLLLAATYGQAGQIEDAEWEAEEILTLLPDFSLTAERERAPFVSPGLDRYIAGLRKAGLPE
jgi:adenylate cyclase